MIQVVLPVVIPAVTGLGFLALRRPGRLRRGLALGSAAAQLAVSLGLLALTAGGERLSSPVGNWPALLGILLAVDALSAILLVASGFITLACLLFSFAEQSSRVEHPLRLPLLMLLVAGVNLSFVTADLFNLFVAFEVVLVGSAALLTLEADDWEVKHAFPYVALNQFGSAAFLIAAALAYGLFGTLNFGLIAERSADLAADPRLTVVGLLLLFVFALKAGLFPLYYWLPNSYPTLPSPLGALFAGLLTKIGVYAMIRIFGTVLPPGMPWIPGLMVALGGATVVLGTLGALTRDFLRGILALLLTQTGFMAIAVGFAGADGLAAAIFYLVHHMVVMTGLFLVSGIVIICNRTDHLGSGGRARPPGWLVATMFLILALSLAGLPPFSGFWGKYQVVEVGVRRGAWVPVAAMLATSLLTLAIVVRIWNRLFWTPSQGGASPQPDRRIRPMSAIAAVVTLVSLALGLQPELLVRVSRSAAMAVLDRKAYVEFVHRISPP